MRLCAAVPVNLGDREERLARQRRRRIDVGAAAVGEQERAVRAAALGDAVGIGEREQRAGRQLGSPAPRLRRRSLGPALRHRAAHPRRGASGRGGTDRGGGRDRHRRRRARARSGPRRCRRRARPRRPRAASTTMRASRGGSGSARSCRPSSVMRPSASMRAELGQQRPRLGKRGARRRIEEGKLARIGRAPLRQIEHEARQIGGEDFRPRIGFERGGLRLVPQPVADAGLGAAGAAAALVGGGARDAHGLEPGQADVGLVARHARQARYRPRCARPRW